ncbi:MAG: GNAT family N-acetyltransferase, partial [Dongiaceae bacterium]
MICIWHAIWDGDYRRYFPSTSDLRRSVDALRVLLEPIIEQFAVVTLDGKLAGFGSRLGDLVDDVWVDPALQGRRLGPRLLAHLIDRIRKNGHR